MLDETLLTALPINNSGVSAAQNVTATAITLSGGKLATPSVPFNLGTIAAGGSTVLNADFSDTFDPLTDEVLSVSGTYCVGTATFCFELTSNFTIPLAAPGSQPESVADDGRADKGHNQSNERSS